VRFVGVEHADAVATVTLDRAPVNAITLDVVEELLAAIPPLGRADVRAVVVTGGGRGFSAGADVSMLGDVSVENHRRARRWVDVQDALEALEKPVVAAIEGFALGGGADLALACDLRVAGESAVLGYPEVDLGFLSATGATYRLPRLLGPARAFRLLAEGTRVPAPEALALGLVDEVVSDGEALAAAQARAVRLAEKATRAIGLMKRVVLAGHGRPRDEALALEWDALLELLATEDAR
jgi:enoyl-CoA hydratase